MRNLVVVGMAMFAVVLLLSPSVGWAQRDPQPPPLVAIPAAGWQIDRGQLVLTNVNRQPIDIENIQSAIVSALVPLEKLNEKDLPADVKGALRPAPTSRGSIASGATLNTGISIPPRGQFLIVIWESKGFGQTGRVKTFIESGGSWLFNDDIGVPPAPGPGFTPFDVTYRLKGTHRVTGFYRGPFRNATTRQEGGDTIIEFNDPVGTLPVPGSGCPPNCIHVGAIGDQDNVSRSIEWSWKTTTPTMTEWGLIALAVLLAGGMGYMIYRRRPALRPAAP